MTGPSDTWPLDSAGHLTEALRDQGLDDDEIAASLPALAQLAAWPAPAPAAADTERLLHRLQPLLPATSPVRQALRRQPPAAVADLRALLGLVRTQVSLFRPTFWLSSAAIVLLGVLLTSGNAAAPTALVLYVTGPLLSYLGVATAFRGSALGLVEFELACPPSSRQLTLARLVIVLGYDTGLAVLGSALIGVSGGAELSALAGHWLAPLLLVAGLSLTLSLWLPVTRAAALVYLGWLATIGLLWLSGNTPGAAAFSPPVETFLGGAGLLFLAGAVAALPAAIPPGCPIADAPRAPTGAPANLLGRRAVLGVAVTTQNGFSHSAAGTGGPMAIEASPITSPRAAATPRNNPLFAVFAWELRRQAAGRFGWVLAGAAFVFFTGLLWFKHGWLISLKDGGERVLVQGSSALGLVHEVVYVELLLFGMFLPFVMAEAVARDYKQRSHELVMATPIPTWAYVWGRYLAGLLTSLGFALELCLAALVANLILHLNDSAYPLPSPGALLLAWALTILPAAILLGSLSFVLGTLWPRRATALKLAVLVAWIMLVVLGEDRFPSWYPYWNPTSYGLAQASDAAFLQRYQAQAPAAAGEAERAALSRSLQDEPPDLRPWALPHLGLIALAVALVALAATRFRRFQNVRE
jgi:hypothetical protein